MRDSLYDKRVFILTSAALSWLTFIGNSWTTRPNIFLKSNLQVKADLHFQPFSILIFFFSYSRFSKKNFESHLVKLDDSYQQNFGLVQSQIYNCKVEFWAREIESVDLPRSVDRFLENSSNFWNTCIFDLRNSCQFVSCLKILHVKSEICQWGLGRVRGSNFGLVYFKIALEMNRVPIFGVFQGLKELKKGQKLRKQVLSICLVLRLNGPLSCSIVNILNLNRTHLLNTTMKRLLTKIWIFQFVQEIVRFWSSFYACWTL